MDSQESILLYPIMWTNSKRHLYQNDSISRIFRLGGEGIEETEIPGVVNEEGESGGEEDLESVES